MTKKSDKHQDDILESTNPFPTFRRRRKKKVGIETGQEYLAEIINQENEKEKSGEDTFLKILF